MRDLVPPPGKSVRPPTVSGKRGGPPPLHPTQGLPQSHPHPLPLRPPHPNSIHPTPPHLSSRPQATAGLTTLASPPRRRASARGNHPSPALASSITTTPLPYSTSTPSPRQHIESQALTRASRRPQPHVQLVPSALPLLHRLTRPPPNTTQRSQRRHHLPRLCHRLAAPSISLKQRPLNPNNSSSRRPTTP